MVSAWRALSESRSVDAIYCVREQEIEIEIGISPHISNLNDRERCSVLGGIGRIP
jgi:hypothetical protein